MMENKTIEYNNITPKEFIITENYSETKINRLISKVENHQITLEELVFEFNIECLRKTKQGYYAVLLQNDGSSVFVFMDDDQMIQEILVFSEFLSNEDFSQLLSEKKPVTISEVMMLDKNTISAPLGMIFLTVHIVKEGVIMITYSTASNGTELLEPVVQKIEYYNNEQLETECDNYILKNIPLILPIDKN